MPVVSQDNRPLVGETVPLANDPVGYRVREMQQRGLAAARPTLRPPASDWRSRRARPDGRRFGGDPIERDTMGKGRQMGSRKAVGRKEEERNGGRDSSPQWSSGNACAMVVILDAALLDTPVGWGLRCCQST